MVLPLFDEGMQVLVLNLEVCRIPVQTKAWFSVFLCALEKFPVVSHTV